MSGIVAPPPPPAPPLRPLPSQGETEASGLGFPRNASQGSMLKVKRRSSKPILAWVQRKLAGGGGSTIRASTVHENSGVNEHGIRGSQAGGTATVTANSRGTRQSSASNLSPPRGGQSQKKSQNPTGNSDFMRRKVAHNSHTPPPLTLTAHKNSDGAQIATTTNGSDSPKATSISFSMAAPGSTWSPSNPLEADDDASIRPLPPTSPPSPTPSRSTHLTASSDRTSGGYMSDPRTFRSNAASTKPTTLLSVEMGGGAGMAHIAQHPPSIAGTNTAPSSPTFGARFSGTGRTLGHGPALSTTSITFSTLPSGVASASSPSSRHPLASAQLPESEPSDDTEHQSDNAHITQAPNLTHHHPRNNPRPSSPPPDNASTLTLASSVAFNSPRGLQNGTPSIVSRFPSLHGYRGSSLTGGFGSGNADEDPAASVRALRPRSRRGSWDSVGTTETGWSAALGGTGGMGRRKGATTVGSMRTGDDLDLDEQDGTSVRGGEEDHIVESPLSGPASPTSITTAGVIQQASISAENDRLTLDRQETLQPAVPITFTMATPDESHVGTPAMEVLDPLETEAELQHETEEEDKNKEVQVLEIDHPDIVIPTQATKTKFVEGV
ncbi:hypothetical protein FRB94_009219 [Tulasnella sp. JGI-2019a]|nr:hypothetical protein FRB93_008348 [Tulasnella sp. JGI-2019a]KAG8995357.1 hypothetical protein FRB94_009219 [Tulasnella sp. JGI-2019a]